VCVCVCVITALGGACSVRRYAGGSEDQSHLLVWMRINRVRTAVSHAGRVESGAVHILSLYPSLCQLHPPPPFISKEQTPSRDSDVTRAARLPNRKWLCSPSRVVLAPTCFDLHYKGVCLFKSRACLVVFVSRPVTPAASCRLTVSVRMSTSRSSLRFSASARRLLSGSSYTFPLWLHHFISFIYVLGYH